MGRNYSFDLYYRLEDLEKALLEVVSFAEPSKHRIDVTLPDGKIVQLPFTSHFKADPVRIQLAGYREINPSFDTALVFPNNPDVIQYWKDELKHSKHPFDPDDFSLGYIYLIVFCGQSYVQLSYMACCTSMSDLFLRSKGIQERFIELARASGALGGLISLEGHGYRSLFNPEYKIFVPELIDDEDEEDWDPLISLDTQVLAVLRALEETHQNL
jgi:hypothetical protein